MNIPASGSVGDPLYWAVGDNDGIPSTMRGLAIDSLGEIHLASSESPSLWKLNSSGSKIYDTGLHPGFLGVAVNASFEPLSGGVVAEDLAPDWSQGPIGPGWFTRIAPNK